MTDMRNPVDDRLLESAQRGDEHALEQLVATYRPGVRRYVSRYCDASDMEDAVQETLIIVYRRLPTLRSLSAFMGWLSQIVQRECRRLASKMFHRDVPFDDVIEQKYISSRDDIELRLDIAMAIQSLSDIYREVIVLRDFEELTLHEIAERLKASPDTIKTRLRRGRQLIREYLLA